MSWELAGEPAGIWTEFVNTETNQSSMQTHTPKVVWKACPRHVFDTIIPPSRELACLHCGQTVRFIVGKHRIRDDGTLEERSSLK